MAKSDKFAKTIGDDELDEIAGGTQAEINKDYKFLVDLGIMHNFSVLGETGEEEKERIAEEMADGWQSVGIGYESSAGRQNFYNTSTTGRSCISRQDAMIKAMRAKKKFLDIEKYM